MERSSKETYQLRPSDNYCDGITFYRHSRSGILPVVAISTGNGGVNELSEGIIEVHMLSGSSESNSNSRSLARSGYKL